MLTRSSYLAILLILPLIVACQPAPEQPTPTPMIPTVPPDEPAGNDITVNLPAGDAARGATLVQPCLYCHYGENAVGTLWEPEDGSPGIGALAQTRFLQDDYAGNATSAEQFLFESIALPSVYVAEGSKDKMNQRYGDFISAQNMADIIAYLLTLQ